MGKLIRITKVQAAQTLLSRAIDLYVDQNDGLSAIVLAGAAEDVLQDLLKDAGRSGSREEMAKLIVALDDVGEGVSMNDAFGLLRYGYNWPRHADNRKGDDDFEVEIDWMSEAGDVIDRAGINLHRVTGEWPARWGDVISMRHVGA